MGYFSGNRGKHRDIGVSRDIPKPLRVNARGYR